MHAETIAIGDELLLGEVVDTNSAAIARRLRSVGLPLRHAASVGDDLEGVAALLRQALARSDVVITTGGLGPTVDDMTREAVALATGRPLVFDAEALAQVEERFRRFGRPMGENNRRQAYRPEGSVLVENPVGTAPCFIVEQAGRLAICLPGVPREMEHLMDLAVLPFLRRRLGLAGVVKGRALKISGMGESLVDERVGDLETLDNPRVGLNAQAGVVVVRITARAAGEEEAGRLIAPVEAAVRERLGAAVFGADADTLEGVVLAELARRGESLAALEGGTEGRLSCKLAAAGREAACFAGGKVLGRAGSLDMAALARQAAFEARADWGLACAVALVEGELQAAWGVWDGRQARQWRRGFGGHPALAGEWAANLALDALRQALSAEQR